MPEASLTSSPGIPTSTRSGRDAVWEVIPCWGKRLITARGRRRRRAKMCGTFPTPLAPGQQQQEDDSRPEHRTP